VIAFAINDYKWHFLRYEITVPIFALPLISRVTIEALETQVVKGSKIARNVAQVFYSSVEVWLFQSGLPFVSGSDLDPLRRAFYTR